MIFLQRRFLLQPEYSPQNVYFPLIRFLEYSYIFIYCLINKRNVYSNLDLNPDVISNIPSSRLHPDDGDRRKKYFFIGLFSFSLKNADTCVIVGAIFFSFVIKKTAILQLNFILFFCCKAKKY